MKTMLSLSTMALAVAATLAASTAPAAADPGAGEALGALIESRFRERGSFFTARERAVIERACGYAPGEWDGRQATIHDGALTCTNGRRADGPEVRAVLRAVAPRIEAFVETVMASPEVTQAIAALAQDAAGEAMREAELALAGLEDLDVDIDVDAGEEVNVDVDPDVDLDVDVDDDPDVDDDDRD